MKSSLTSLNLNGWVYVGGVPDYNVLSFVTDYLTGFEGDGIYEINVIFNNLINYLYILIL